MFQCKVSQFLNFKKFEFLNLCATQVVRGESGKCYNFVIYNVGYLMFNQCSIFVEKSINNTVSLFHSYLLLSIISKKTTGSQMSKVCTLKLHRHVLRHI